LRVRFEPSFDASICLCARRGRKVGTGDRNTRCECRRERHLLARVSRSGGPNPRVSHSIFDYRSGIKMLVTVLRWYFVNVGVDAIWQPAKIKEYGSW